MYPFKLLDPIWIDYRSLRTVLNEVLQARESGRTVAYLGNIIDDIPAMASADVAIGFDEDPQGFISKTVCDVILAGDLNWLPRLIALSRRFEQFLVK